MSLWRRFTWLLAWRSEKSIYAAAIVQLCQVDTVTNCLFDVYRLFFVTGWMFSDHGHVFQLAANCVWCDGALKMDTHGHCGPVSLQSVSESLESVTDVICVGTKSQTAGNRPDTHNFITAALWAARLSEAFSSRSVNSPRMLASS